MPWTPVSVENGEVVLHVDVLVLVNAKSGHANVRRRAER